MGGGLHRPSTPTFGSLSPPEEAGSCLLFPEASGQLQSRRESLFLSTKRIKKSSCSHPPPGPSGFRVGKCRTPGGDLRILTLLLSLSGVFGSSPGPCFWEGLQGWLCPPEVEREPPCTPGQGLQEGVEGIRILGPGLKPQTLPANQGVFNTG